MQLFSGLEYLKIDVASKFGLDKKSWDDRIMWFDQNENELDSLVKKAEEPALFYAGVQAYRAASKGEAIGYPISLDATCSGLQLLACLTGDRSASLLCNVLDAGYRADAYTGVYQMMVNLIGEDAKIKREDTKEAIMTAFYGSTAVPKKVFGEGQLLQVFEEVMNEVAPGPWELNKVFLDVWDDNALSHDWVMPDNFHVHIKVMNLEHDTVNFLNEPFDVMRKVNSPVKEGRSLSANAIHSLDGMVVREMARRCSYDQDKVTRVRELIEHESYHCPVVPNPCPDTQMVQILWDHYEASGYLSARILDHLRAWNWAIVMPNVIHELVDSLPAKPFDLITIHDCFRCLPNYGNDLRRQYNLQLQLIAKSELLSYLLSQIVGRDIKVGKLDPELHKDILETNYALS